jgi:hypothetical protein
MRGKRFAEKARTDADPHFRILAALSLNFADQKCHSQKSTDSPSGVNHVPRGAGWPEEDRHDRRVRQESSPRTPDYYRRARCYVAGEVLAAPYLRS